MSSGFVSGGTNEQPIERDEEWLKAQQEIEATRRRKEEEKEQDGGKSLYEVLQANKAKKQEAFEESIKFKNQFRSLDEDEAEFLDSVLESTRAKEAAVRTETTEQLDAFRRQQEEAERAARLAAGTEGSPAAEEEQWVPAGKKRKKGKDRENLLGVKLRKASSTDDKSTKTAAENAAASDTNSGASAGTKPTPSTLKDDSPKQAASSSNGLKSAESSEMKEKPVIPSKPAPAGLGLAGYSSDEDD
ncbi:N-terminal domain of NEFA-interacting nuclear protein NIP30-domain-containing protein [Phyllosticta citribraziliensis]|uniref:N-terminal domain of NEFA-interacting nuclear protein NIP30-domain-containing protein n=1 Tax=Phyllosticta citribraziliensis TaxID=989973 RepID=A0ABR1LL67_9PEZI